MTSKEVAHKLFLDSWMTTAEYASRLGISRQSVYERLNKKKPRDMPSHVLSEMVGVFGYKLVVMKNPPKDAYVIE